MARTPESFTPFKPCPRNVPSFDNVHTNGNGHEGNGSFNGRGVSKALLRIGEFVPDKVHTNGNGNGHHENGHSNGNGHKKLLILEKKPTTPQVAKPNVDINPDGSSSFTDRHGVHELSPAIASKPPKERTITFGKVYETETHEPQVTSLERELFGSAAEDVIAQSNAKEIRENLVKKEKASALPDRIKIYDARESASVKKWQKAIDRGDKQDALQAAVEIDALEARQSETFLAAVRDSRIKKADAQRRNRTN